jgi:uncharacterized membrane protein YecN with MAPEG domain
MSLSVTTLYAGLLGLIAVALASFAGRARVTHNVSLGDGGKPDLLEAMRRHANFVEFVPLFLVLLAIVELNGAPKWWLHVLGAVMVASRIIHPFGLSFDRMNTTARMIGAAGSFQALAAVSLTALWQAIR